VVIHADAEDIDPVRLPKWRNQPCGGLIESILRLVLVFVALAH
jgi:hypothetical protein